MTSPITLKDIYTLINSSSTSSVEKASYYSFCHNVVDLPSSNAASHILATIPLSQEPSYIPLACLSFALSRYSGHWPVFDVIRCHGKLWHNLPEEGKSGHDLENRYITDTASKLVKGSYSCLKDLLPYESEKAAIEEPLSRRSLTHRMVANFVRNFSLPVSTHDERKPIVVVALSNGPLLGLACLAVAAYYTAAPINSSTGADQFRIDVQQSGAKAVLVFRIDIKRLRLDDNWVAECGLQVLAVDANSDLTFNVSPLAIPAASIHPTRTANGPDDLCLILFTSGTSGTKKVVPLTLHNIASGVAFVIESWGLTDKDVCLNMMPLNHVGGLIRNLFAPILAGGSTICCPAFDPNLFWDVLEEQNPTWYYASPSMHSTILAEVTDRGQALSKSQIRLVCNAAGGLLPSLASQLRKTFRCTVLPSYGMTECMPISTPPLSYQLDRSGTSGVSVGPEIAILDVRGHRVQNSTVGCIGVRGPAVFPGYLKLGGLDTSPFTKDGWFDTGDMGYLDVDGYLYLTGRNKEVVNRGGELISPFEVEEAIMIASQTPDSQIYKRISEVLVFSAPHDVLQEVVAVVIVTPPGAPRPDLRQLHEALKSSLHQPKWPFVIVYMDNVPKKNNKLLRVRLSERLGFKPLTDDMILAERHFEARCPPPDTSLSESIDMSTVEINLETITSLITQRLTPAFHTYVCRSEHDGFPEVTISPHKQTPRVVAVHAELPMAQEGLYDSVDGYLIPRSINHIDCPLPLDDQGRVDKNKLEIILRDQNPPSSSRDMSSTENKIKHIYSTILGCSPSDICAGSDFFEMGGDSLKAGRLLSLLRKEFQVRIPIGILFQKSRVEELTQIVDDNLSQRPENFTPLPKSATLPGCTKTYSSTNTLLLLIQLIPIVILYPMKRSLKWTVFLYILSYSTLVWPLQTTMVDRFINLLVAMAASKLATQICAPILAISIKWLVVGRYKEGMYPMWGPYHTRWWFVQKVLSVGGKGIFGFSDTTRILYFRLLGARIGKGVSIAKGTVLGEYDLLDIGDNVELDSCTCRPFAVERNTSMCLRRIVLGANSSIGLKSFVAPGTILPENTCIGASSSTWETKDATEVNRDLSTKRVPKSNVIISVVLGLPIQALVWFVSLLPWMGGLIGVIVEEPGQSSDIVQSVTIWFADARRVGFHFLARVLSVSVGPFVWFAMIVLVKLVLDRSIGKLKPGLAQNRSQMQKFRMSLMASLVPKGDLSKLTELFGTHYEFTSMAVRALGGKVGSRVYWPGSGPTIQDFELLDIGNNVVFGSRSHIITSDGIGSQEVRIGDNTMVADRVTILPGAAIGKNVVLGSGALTRRDTIYPSDTVWVGSKEGGAICLTITDGRTTELKGSNKSGISTTFSESERTLCSDHSMLSSGSTIQQPLITTTPPSPSLIALDLEKSFPSITLSKADVSPDWSDTKDLRPDQFTHKTKKPVDPDASPFGKAFYDGNANYHVLGMPIIFSYSIFTNIFVSIYWNIAPMCSIQVLAVAMKAHPEVFGPVTARPVAIYALFLSMMIFVMAAQAVVALSIVVCAKWALMGRRAPGKYDWDKSSYCQRWQIFLTVERIRRYCYGGNGIIGLLTGTHFAVLFFRALGANIGTDCALWAGGRASLLFTEPDLLTLGDRVAVDDASLVAHINSRGNFSLNALSVGDRSVLRSGSRLLSGATMGADACLLEHTLVMAGDVVEEGTTYQGWPADEFVGDRERPCGQTGVAKEAVGMASFETLVADCPA
ncbi:hypothetical protein MMC11_000429 [Xylographa trunciseda]|nr:hypothetical protein [Xylographa trunciseda]